MSRILLLSTNFLYLKSTNGQIARTFFEEVRKNGHSITVLTTVKLPLTDRLPLIEYHSDIDVKVIQTPSWYKWIVYFFKFISRDIAQWIDIDNLYYRKKALKIGLKMIKEGKIDYIHSICVGYSSHLLGQKLHDESGVPWIAQFYDPWVDNFYRVFKTKLFRNLDANNERKLVQSAKHIIHSNTVIRDVWERRYGENIRNKVSIIPFNLGTVPDVKTKKRADDDKSVVFAHIGNFYNQRNSLVFIEAVNNVLKQIPELRTRIKVNFVGRVTKVEKERIIQYKLDDIFNLVGLLSEEGCNEYYQNADVFISVDASSEKPNVFYPSKIIKYFYFNKPILGITPKGGPSDIAFKEAGYASFSNDDIKGIEGFIMQALQDYNSICDFNHNYWEQFTPQYLAKLYETSILRAK